MLSLDRDSYKCFAVSGSKPWILHRMGSPLIIHMASFKINEQQLSSAGIEITNIVAKLDLDIELDLSYLSTQIPNSTYEPEQYPSLIFRPEKLPTVLVTRSGILLFTGGNSIGDLKASYQCISDELEEIGVSDVGETENIEIVNIVSSFELSSEVDLNYLSVSLGLESVEYEPEQFPGLVYRIEKGPVVLIFASGKVVITGAETTAEILNAADTIRELIPN
ncbi:MULTISPECIES: TATA-box-binding protein [Haloferacaceae]|uniref:TATA-box-binding protein n=1 Tax=Halorubrum glutamatedens TaxID=2707018 RepID=A0ABD5QT26_9EURY|nr:TATA-box-binding protein [Halobellus captivus]